MKKLALLNCRTLNDSDLEGLIDSPLAFSGNLKELDMSGCSRLTDKGVAVISHALGKTLYVGHMHK